MGSSERLRCQVLVVGCGPAGGELARGLARSGVDVLVVDALPDLRACAFSSAALPLEAIDCFGLPPEVVASRWSGWQLFGPGEGQRQWSQSQPLGAVLDFGALRHWLALQASGWGARLQLGLRAKRCEPVGEHLRTSLGGAAGVAVEVESDWVVDASGQGRALIGEPPPSRDPLVRGVGVEWLLRVPEPLWSRWSQRLSFCLGSQWMPQGYGWVFPMQPGLLKLGVCRLEDPRRQGSQPALGACLLELQRRWQLQKAEVLDRHGGVIRSSVRRREPHRRGRLLGLGDAISTANLLGGEGIRHAMASGRLLVPALLEALAGNERLLDRYPRQLKQALGWRWSLSGRLAQRTWLGLVDDRGDRRLAALLHGLEQTAAASDLSALLFHYRFERYGGRMLPYLLGWR
ncbi:NAD(P)/FAD-dependent oxidoreductase [Synechococcus sp. ATX 2A4]|uniref:NAD(P)/FAD-dependent oxidoreductase n=1 Tax=Synechococcus sp. ATX 2A4 TaxID=2823727 RepID=UPI0020CC8E16|nr:NAD(P)/FAD-dependent oxidoreductase [Synechococcus sp. ATX 2A4]